MSIPTLALSIPQPWAWMIVHGFKNIENRSWSTNVRGRIYVHADKVMTRTEYKHGLWIASHGTPTFQLPAFKDLERGGIIGEVTITDCVDRSDSPWFTGDYGFVLSDPKVLPFRRLSGGPRFFQVPPPTNRSPSLETTSHPMPSDPDTRRRLNDIAHAVDERVPEGFGFFVLVFPFNGNGEGANYVSNGKCEDVIRVMKEWLLKCSAAEDWMRDIT